MSHEKSKVAGDLGSTKLTTLSLSLGRAPNLSLSLLALGDRPLPLVKLLTSGLKTSCSILVVLGLLFLNTLRANADTYHDTVANLNKVQAKLWCCWTGGRFKRVPVACDESDKPTHLEALRQLRANLIRDHGGEDHVHDSEWR